MQLNRHSLVSRRLIPSGLDLHAGGGGGGGKQNRTCNSILAVHEVTVLKLDHFISENIRMEWKLRLDGRDHRIFAEWPTADGFVWHSMAM
ncbi:hypothetical protein ACLOJK_021934 [Asimina triloba]